MTVSGLEINFRKLAAIEILFLGSKLIVAEYVCGVLLSVALGLFVFFRGYSFWQVLLGIYLICLGINYVPLLVYAIAVGNKLNAREEIADELADARKAMSRYRAQSLLLLVPLLVPILVLTRERRRSRETLERPR